MSNKILLWLLVAALPGYRFEFPRDHFNHADYGTEWWYYTGNLAAKEGHRFGYELTFFRQVNPQAPKDNSVWNSGQLYLAHLALSDLTRGTFEHQERLNRAGPGLAGIDFPNRTIWNGNWEVHWTSDAGRQHLRAIGNDFALDLNLTPAKPFVIHGVDGVSRKGPAPGEASHYISFTRLNTSGTIRQDNRSSSVTGASWMDHEFFSETKDGNLRGWDWFAIQLHNGDDLMLYRLRLANGANSPFSSGTFVDGKGNARHLSQNEFRLAPGGNWSSKASGATYPLEWIITVPSLALQLSVDTRLKNQELYTPHSISPGYWEGAVDYSGSMAGRPVDGQGYLEMTGYKEPLRMGH